MSTFTKRIRRLRRTFEKTQIDSFFVSKPENIAYLTGFRGDDSYLCITRANKYLITDSRYSDELRKCNIGCRILLREKKHTLTDHINDIRKKEKLTRLGFEPNHLSHHDFLSFKKAITIRSLKPCFKMVDQQRIIKDEEEIRAIKRAISIAEKAFRHVAETHFRTRYREKDVADYLEYTMRRLGADMASFPSIVAVGRKAAFPHAVAGKPKLKRNTLLLVDFGAKKGGYCSDLTRTLLLGRITARFRHLYRLVQSAQELAISLIKPGERIGKVDEAVRDFFKKEKVDQYFTHALGHGIGLEVHESPSIHYSSKESFKENMVFTIEPGLYIDGWGGIRIEDMVRVCKRGCERLTKNPYSY